MNQAQIDQQIERARRDLRRAQDTLHRTKPGAPGYEGAWSAARAAQLRLAELSALREGVQ